MFDSSKTLRKSTDDPCCCRAMRDQKSNDHTSPWSHLSASPNIMASHCDSYLQGVNRYEYFQLVLDRTLKTRKILLFAIQVVTFVRVVFPVHILLFDVKIELKKSITLRHATPAIGVISNGRLLE